MSNLKTNRLKFRELTPCDVDNLQKIFADPIAMKYYPSTKSVPETLQWIDWNIQSYKDHGFGLWALIEKKTGNFIGQCGLILQRDVDGVDEIEIGYLLVRKYWKLGFATEAADACRDYAFTKLDLPRLISLIDPENTPSIKVAERNGMIFEKKVKRWGKTISVYQQTSDSYRKLINT